jgi:hypothetical protein
MISAVIGSEWTALQRAHDPDPTSIHRLFHGSNRPVASVAGNANAMLPRMIGLQAAFS